MEKAIVMGKLSHRVPKNIIESFKTVEGVFDVNTVFGPYDFYAVINAESKEMLRDISLKIRSFDGVLDTLTSYVCNLDDIKPEPRGPFSH